MLSTVQEKERETEIQHLQVTVVADHDVVRLNVAVCDTGGVRSAQRSCHLFAKREEGVDRIVARNHGAQSLSSNQLHDNETAGFTLADVLNSNDVWVVERGSSFGFLCKASNACCILGEFCGEDFESNFAIETCVFSEPDFTHTTRAEFRNDAVV
jgi:hypothetical protein